MSRSARPCTSAAGARADHDAAPALAGTDGATCGFCGASMGLSLGRAHLGSSNHVSSQYVSGWKGEQTCANLWKLLMVDVLYIQMLVLLVHIS
uniref:Uncharacterized protein n=1 Tax=Triticum urartu TaxID=4572 RepID=A0A8R7PCV4_TRIUA